MGLSDNALHIMFWPAGFADRLKRSNVDWVDDKGELMDFGEMSGTGIYNWHSLVQNPAL
jgi:hypothetical protein